MILKSKVKKNFRRVKSSLWYSLTSWMTCRCSVVYFISNRWWGQGREEMCQQSVTVNFLQSTGPGRVEPGSWSEQSQVVVETVTKTSTTQKYSAPIPSAGSDASKVVLKGTGLCKAIPMKEAHFMVDASQAGACAGALPQCSVITLFLANVKEPSVSGLTIVERPDGWCWWH